MAVVLAFIVVILQMRGFNLVLPPCTGFCPPKTSESTISPLLLGWPTHIIFAKFLAISSPPIVNVIVEVFSITSSILFWWVVIFLTIRVFGVMTVWEAISSLILGIITLLFIIIPADSKIKEFKRCTSIGSMQNPLECFSDVPENFGLPITVYVNLESPYNLTLYDLLGLFLDVIFWSGVANIGIVLVKNAKNRGGKAFD